MHPCISLAGTSQQIEQSGIPQLRVISFQR
uniref:Uncharacterized protein n=1 Tax=Setaria italica TaxID=4555 RepID=K4ANQ3_SETIT